MDGDITSVIFKGVHYEIEIMAGGCFTFLNTAEIYNVVNLEWIRVFLKNIFMLKKL